MLDAMKLSTGRSARRTRYSDGMLERLSGKVIGQPGAMEAIVPYIRMFEAGLNPEGRPAGVFLLLGPTGTGKTRTVEALAEVLHGTRKHHLRIDCGEYQMEHEVAKLTGAPPGYLGHRETQPVLTQARLAAITSQNSGLSIVLFDEIEKAAPSMTRLLLGVLDKGTLRLGDNSAVNFERTLIFLTSNVGARHMQDQLTPGLGFGRGSDDDQPDASRLASTALRAAKRTFAPEFMNRIDSVVAYQPLSEDALDRILTIELRALQDHLVYRLGSGAFRLNISDRGRKFLLAHGASAEYGAREIKRAVHRLVAQPLAEMVTNGRSRAGGRVRIDHRTAREELSFRFESRN